MILSSIIGLYQDQKAGLQRTLMQQTEVLNLGPVSLHQRFHPLALPFLEIVQLLLTLLHSAVPKRPKAQLTKGSVASVVSDSLRPYGL